MERLIACARVSAVLSEVARLVTTERRDEFVASSAQVMGCILSVPADKVASACAQVTAEFDAKDAARKAAQS